MAKVKLILKVNVGDEASPEYVDVGGQSGANFSESSDTTETTHKLSGRYKTFEYGYAEWSIECEGLYIINNQAYEYLRNCIRNEEKAVVQWVESDGKKYEGRVLVTECSLDSPYDDEARYSMTLVGDGEYEEVAA